jgi:hypothetical protein
MNRIHLHKVKGAWWVRVNGRDIIGSGIFALACRWAKELQ